MKPKRRPSGYLEYKVVELATVDEASLEQVLNEWVGQGWALDGVRFAMRDASKRPAMAFVMFTRMAKSKPKLKVQSKNERNEPRALLARQRLAQLAGLSDDGSEPEL